MSHGRHGRVTTSQKAVSAGAAVASGAFAAGALAAVAVAGGQAPAPSVHTAPDPLHSQTVNAPVTADETALVVHSAKVQEARTQSHRSYHVKSGDTLSGIAQLYCGDAAKYHSLATSNGIADPSQMNQSGCPSQTCRVPFFSRHWQRYPFLSGTG